MSEAITLVELDIDFCQLTYGVSPCNAGLGLPILDEDAFEILDEDGLALLDETGVADGTGTKKCFNTYATCQDRANYDRGTKTLRYAVGSPGVARADIEAIPSIVSVRHSPGRIRIGEDLGERASVRIAFEDHRHSDLDLDPYVDERPYDPLTQGTYWGRFVARNPFLIDRPLRVYHGTSDQALADMEERHYVVESLSGPDLNGNVSITAKDPLRLADGDQAQAPAASTGRLSADLTSSATSLTLEPAGIGDTEYSGVGWIAINEEICEVTGRTNDTLTIVRSQLGTTAQAHKTGDTVQVVLEYTPQAPSAILADLLETYANVPSSFIDSTEWAQSDTLFVGRNFSGYIASPVPVKDLISELLEQVGANMWWDETAQKIRYEPLRVVVSPPVVNAEQMLAESFSSRSLPEKRLSQVWTYYGQINPLEPDEPRNYRAVAVDIDADAENANEYGRPAIRKIFSRWVDAAGRSAAQELNAKLLARRRDPPRQFEFGLARYAGTEFKVGDTIAVSALPLQDDEGRPEQVVSQVISLGAQWDTFELVAEEFRFTTTDQGSAGQGNNPSRPLDIVTDTANVNLRDSYNANYPDPEDLRQTIGSVDTSTDTITLNGHGYQDDARVVFFGADLPAGLTEGTTYFVISAAANTFQVSTTQGGSAVDLTDAGSGTQEVRLVIDVPVVIDPNVQVFSTSTAVPALTVGNWPDGINLTLTIRTGAYIVGAGGAGGDGSLITALNDGGDGGTAFFTRYPITVDNEGTIGGGGGGGGAGFFSDTVDPQNRFVYSGAGGGGAGRIPGAAGARVGTTGATLAEPGTLTTGGAGSDPNFPPPISYSGGGGDGGDLGQAGSDGATSANPVDPPEGIGGAAGTAIDGDSFVTLSGSGSVLGAQIN